MDHEGQQGGRRQYDSNYADHGRNLFRTAGEQSGHGVVHEQPFLHSTGQYALQPSYRRQFDDPETQQPRSNDFVAMDPRFGGEFGGDSRRGNALPSILGDLERQETPSIRPAEEDLLGPYDAPGMTTGTQSAPGALDEEAIHRRPVQSFITSDALPSWSAVSPRRSGTQGLVPGDWGNSFNTLPHYHRGPEPLDVTSNESSQDLSNHQSYSTSSSSFDAMMMDNIQRGAQHMNRNTSTVHPATLHYEDWEQPSAPSSSVYHDNSSYGPSRVAMSTFEVRPGASGNAPEPQYFAHQDTRPPVVDNMAPIDFQARRPALELRRRSAHALLQEPGRSFGANRASDSNVGQGLPTPILDRTRLIPPPRSRTSSVSQASTADESSPLNDSDPPVLFCPVGGCSSHFSGDYRKGNVARHVRVQHGGSGGSPSIFACEEDGCGKKFRRKDARLKHYRNRHSHRREARPALPRK